MAAGSNPPAFDRAAIEEVGRIDRMLRAYERAQPAPPSHRRFFVGGFALTVVLIAALLFMRVGSTEISLDLRVERLAFELGAKAGPDRNDRCRTRRAGRSGTRRFAAGLEQRPAGRSTPAG